MKGKQRTWTKLRNGLAIMVKVRLIGINRVKARLADGTRVEYHSIRGAKGSRFWKSTDTIKIGSPEYLSAYQAAKRPPTGGDTFGKLIIDYLDSGEFRKLAPRTKADYRRWIDHIRDRFASAPLSVFENPKVRQAALKWRDQWNGKNAEYAWTVLRRIVSWAVDRGELGNHYLRGGGGLYKSDRADVIWTEPEIVTVEDSAPAHIHLALRAAAETGLRPGDLVRLSRSHVMVTPNGRRIQIRTAKKKRMASIPVTQKMAAIIDAAPGLLILTDRDGNPWEAKRLAHAVTYWRDRLGLRKELRFYDARGSAATRLVLAGASLSEVAACMGWSVKTAAQMIEVYATLDPGLADSVLVKLEQIRDKTAK